MKLLEAAKEKLGWWANNILQSFRRLRHPVFPISFWQMRVLVAGACTSNPTLQTQGFWNRKQLQALHINVKELYVVFICLTIFCKNINSEVHKKFELDNKTAVCYINHVWGCKSVACDTVAKKVWDWCITRNIWITAMFIPGSCNSIADSLSRKHLSDHEWQLNQEIFQKVSTNF